MTTRIWTVDAFADAPFSGNPAGVCLLEAPAAEAWMRAVAAEMNHSETAFLVPGADVNTFSLRWFTPEAEVELCGHATLASAHVLWSGGHVAKDQTIRFDTLSGPLAASSGDGGLIWLDFPSESGAPAALPEGMDQALGVTFKAAHANRMDFLVEVEGEDDVLRCSPDLVRLRSMNCRGVIVTARSSRAGVDFVSRFFAPAVGVDEDPVTGSAHCFLGPYWGARLGRTSLTARQISRRSGTVLVRLDGERVRLGGRAVTILQGEMTCAPTE